MRKALCAPLWALLLACVACAALADAPYASYTYSEWNDSVRAPAGYTVERTVRGGLVAGGPWKDAQDLCVTPSGAILLADTGNNRILEYDAAWNLVRAVTHVGRGEGAIALAGPSGLHASPDGALYIALKGSSQAVVVDWETLDIALLIENPSHALLGEDFVFSPTKIGADNAGRIYILSAGCYAGLLQFSPQGAFMGYYGSNRVEVTAKVLFNYYWKMIMTSEQRENLTSILPVEYSNLHCAPDGFVYAATVATTYAVNQIKRLNPLGNNTYLARGEREINFGDMELATVQKGTATGLLMPTFVDVVTSADCEFIFAVDRAYGRVFERDRNGNLIATFGALGQQEGTFQSPAAIALQGDRVLVLDAGKNAVTVFAPTRYTALVHEAVTRYNAGEYAASRDVWLQVLKRNTNATQAYAGIGRALLKENRFDEALAYFRLGDSRAEYSQTYRIVRLNALRRNAVPFACALTGLIALWRLTACLSRRKGGRGGLLKRAYGVALRALRLSRNTVFPRVLAHPFAGFDAIRFGHRVALWPSALITALFVMATVYAYVGAGYLFNANNIADINLWLLLAKSAGLLIVFCAAQWSVSILTNGSGRLRDIVITACYALAPYTAALFVGTWLSNYLILGEMYASYIITGGMLWSLALLLIGTMTIHEVSFARAVGFLALTVAGMAVIIFVGVLFYTLLEQLVTFLSTLYVEIVFRL